MIQVGGMRVFWGGRKWGTDQTAFCCVYTLRCFLVNTLSSFVLSLPLFSRVPISPLKDCPAYKLAGGGGGKGNKRPRREREVSPELCLPFYENARLRRRTKNAARNPRLSLPKVSEHEWVGP